MQAERFLIKIHGSEVIPRHKISWDCEIIMRCAAQILIIDNFLFDYFSQLQENILDLNPQ
jgi:hypothetical protein